MASPLEIAFAKRGPIRTIGVIGMGYVGIPSAALFSSSRTYQKVYGFQRDSPSSGYKISMLNRGENPLKGEEPELSDLIREVAEAGKFICTSDFSHITECDAVTLAIQTPFKNPKDLEPDWTALFDGIQQVGKYLSNGSLVVLESTVTPGTTAGIAREILERESGMKAGKDFGLAHAPERVMVGRLIRNIREHDRIVGGFDDESTKRTTELYFPLLTKGRIISMTATAAEVEKTAENTFRDLQIAAANQLALYCEAIRVNFYEVRQGIASLKEEEVTRAILWPGAGVGGHCLTKDTYHLERGARTLGGPLDYPEGRESLFILARNINDFMPRHMVHLTLAGIERAGKKVRGSKIAILGWAFIANSDDARNTPSELYRDLMVAEGAEVQVHDPYVLKYPCVKIESKIETVMRGASAIVIFTGHKEYQALVPEQVKALCGCKSPVIIDGRNVVDGELFIQAGFVYKGIGRGDLNNHPLI
jgi:UDP-N-acetyl-D-mannosaminuronic acid dehydrogenase